jgi:cytochrome P450
MPRAPSVLMRIISVAVRANMEVDEKDRLSEGELLAQMNTLIFAAHVRLHVFFSSAFSSLIFRIRPSPQDTTSSALARILHMLSHDQERQARLRQEVADARAAHGSLDYDQLMGLRALASVPNSGCSVA